MRLTVVLDDEQAFPVDLDKTMALEDVKALLEVESGIASADQRLFWMGKQLTGDKETLENLGLKDDDMILLQQEAQMQASSSYGGGGDDSSREAEIERYRLSTLGNPQMMEELRQTQPELADAAQNNPRRFGELLAELQSRSQSARLQQQHEEELLHSDPFDVEAQRRIEEAIRQQQVLESFESTMENMPESFGRVHMLYVNTEVNGHKVQAFVDSGAQSTIMSPDCAERCGIMRLLDRRFSGIAKGVGTAKILGRVHSAQLKMGDDLYLACTFTIMEGRDIDILFGLDMLKRHQAVIDLKKDALVIQGREIKFLAEHELPKEMEQDYEVDEAGNPILPGSSLDAKPAPAARSGSSEATSFPGSGNTLGAPPASAPPPVAAPSPAPAAQRQGAGQEFPEEHIAGLTALGISRAEAIQFLQMAGGNPDIAASLVF